MTGRAGGEAAGSGIGSAASVSLPCPHGGGVRALAGVFRKGRRPMRTTRRLQPRAAAVAVVMIVAGVGGLFLTGGTASADVTSVRGTGFGISASAGGTFLIPPTPDPNVNPPLLVADESSTD